MRRYLIASHGKLSKGIIDSAMMIAGNLPNVDCLSVTPDDSEEDIINRLKEFLQKGGVDDEPVVLTDISGGSVTNAFVNYMRNTRMHLVTGYNLSLLLELLLSDQDTDISELIKSSIVKAREGIIYINDIIGE